MPCGFQPAGPLGFPETPGGHIRPFTCLVGSRARRSVSFCYGREFLSTALPTSMTPPPDPRFSGDWAAAGEKDKAASGMRRTGQRRRKNDKQRAGVTMRRAYSADDFLLAAYAFRQAAY